MRLIITKTKIVIITSPVEIQSGLSTQIHDQSITPTNFNTMKISVSTEVNPSPPPLDVTTCLLYIMLFPFCIYVVNININMACMSKGYKRVRVSGLPKLSLSL